MKYVLEFGIRGGFHVDNIIVPKELGCTLAARMVGVFSRGMDEPWTFRPGVTRLSWMSDTHFVSLTKLGHTRGPASSLMWRKDDSGLLRDSIVENFF